MEATAKEKYISMPARKLRRVINEVRGKKVTEALNILHFMPYFAAEVIEKNLKSAVANAAQKWGATQDSLMLTEIYVDEGPTSKRVRPRAQGRMYQRLKRTSHLTVKVSVSNK